MMIVRTIAELRELLAATPFGARGGRRGGRRLGLVPTMGAFHEGHASLMRHAVAACDEVVVSLFVNPTQFNEAADLVAYPRDERADAAWAQEIGVDWLFAPSPAEMYPAGFQTTISVGGVSAPLEGARRGERHFQGVATVVCKLLNIVSPDVAYFGAKDAQQVAVIRTMVRDLAIATEIEALATVRDADGLALSSRNALLTPEQRAQAPALYRALTAVRDAVAGGERDPGAAVAAGVATLDGSGAQLEYLELVDPATMVALTALHGDALAVIAARLGSVRLIDNTPVPLVRATSNQQVATPVGAPTN